MMWGLLLAIGGAAFLFLLRALRAGDVASEIQEGQALKLYQDQLAEIDTDCERGLISAAEAESIKNEVRRRILKAAQVRPLDAIGPAFGSPVHMALALGLPAIALGLYGVLGNPALPSRAVRPSVAIDKTLRDVTHRRKELETLTAELADRMKRNSSDVIGWRMLGRAYVDLSRPEDAVQAFRNAVAIDKNDVATLAQLGEALVAASEGRVTDEAFQIFTNALKIDKTEPRSQFYLGLGHAQRNDPEKALEIWNSLIASTNEDSAWVGEVKKLRDQLLLRKSQKQE